MNGGATRVAIDEAVGLSQQGINVVFLSAVGPISEELRRSNIRVICLHQQDLVNSRQSPEVVIQALWNESAYRAMDHILEQCNPQDTVVHVHGFSQALSASPIRRARDGGFAVVCTLHDYFPACPNGGFFHYPDRTICYRTPLSLSCVAANCDKRNYLHKLYRVLRSHVQRRLCGVPSLVSHYIAPSRSAAIRCHDYLPSDAKVFIVPNPSSVQRKDRVAVGSNNSLIVVGRLDFEKGIDVLIKAGKSANANFVFVGDGPLREIALAGGSNIVTGWLSHSDVMRHIEAARCLVFPSLLPETFGLSVVDAAARGVPSIVTTVCGVAEYVQDNMTGWHVQPGNIEQLSARLRTIQCDDAVSAAGDAAYTKYWDHPFTVDWHINALLEIYAEVLRPTAPANSCKM